MHKHNFSASKESRHAITKHNCQKCLAGKIKIVYETKQTSLKILSTVKLSGAIYLKPIIGILYRNLYFQYLILHSSDISQYSVSKISMKSQTA